MPELESLDHHLLIERKIIHLLLSYREAADILLDDNIDHKFFDETHQLLVKSIFEQYVGSDYKSLLTRQSYQSIVIRFGKQGQKIDVPASLKVFDECELGVDADLDDIHQLKKELKESYVDRRAHVIINEFYDARKKKGSTKASRELVDKLASALDLTEVKESMFITLDDLKDEYIEHIENLKANPEEIITCDIPEIDEAMNVGFRPGHLTLIAGDVGAHKCVAEGEKIQLADGTQAAIEDLYSRFVRNEPADLISFDEENRTLVSQRVLFVSVNGKKPCFKVTTRLGFSCTVTSNHPFLTFDGYVRQEQLNTGDKIAVARRLPFGNKQVSTDYSIWLGCMVSDGGCTSRTYTFTNFDASIVERFRNACRCLNGQLKIKNCHDRPVRGNYRTTGLRQLGIDSKIDGKSALTKTLPDEVFSWDRASVAWLLRAMYGCDGCFSVRMIRDREQCAVVYSTSSRQLSLQVRDLLLKFGLVAKIGQCNANYKGQIKRSWQVKLSDAGQITTFIQTIGFLGKKQTKCHELLKYLLGKTTNRNVDTIPSEVWPLLLNKFTEHGTSYYMCRRLMRHGGDQGKGKEGYCGTKHKDINRRLFKDIAELLKDEELRRVADEEVVWDRIISIEPVGVVQTYDVAMPKWHNFVVGGLITHNTNTMMNIGLNIYEKGHNVLFVPLEMNRIDLAGRIVSNRAKIEFNKMAHPRLLSDEELLRIKEAKVWLNQNHKFAILDVSERTSVESLRRQIEKHAIYFKPDLVVIDYIALMEVDKAQRNDLAIGEILKNLRFMGRRYGFHIMSAAQIGRAALMKIREEGFEAARPDSTALRGSHEYSADSDSIFALFPNPEETNKLKVFCIKARWGKSGGTYHLTIHPSYCQIYSEKGTKDIATESFEKSGVDIQELNIPASQVHAEMLPDLEWAHADIGEQKVDDLGLLATSEVKAPADDFGELGKAAPQSDDDLLNMIG